MTTQNPHVSWHSGFFDVSCRFTGQHEYRKKPENCGLTALEPLWLCIEFDFWSSRPIITQGSSNFEKGR